MSGRSVSVKCLASGSNGNVYLIKGGETAILIDCGLPARSIVSFLKRQQIDPRALAAILITHEHSDHIQSVGTMSRRFGIPVVANALTLEAITAQAGDVIPQTLTTGSCTSVGDLDVASFPISHDCAEPVGYFVACGESRVCLLTDTGRIQPHLREHVALADLVILESNHDSDLLAAGPYPQSLKDRIRGDKGHLSNHQAALLLAEAHSSRPQTVWLAHLSAMNNNPTRARRSVSSHLTREGIDSIKIAVTERDRPSLSWASDNTGFQLRLL